jgi:hypothetical protein
MTQADQNAEQIRNTQEHYRVVYIHVLDFRNFFVRKWLVFCSPTRVSFLWAEVQPKTVAFPESAATA